MDENKTPVDILDEILNRSEEPRPSPAGRPLKFDPPAPEDGPPAIPPKENPPLAERLLPWLGALLGGAVLALILCGVQLFSVNARLDGLQAAVGELEVADTLLNEKKLLQRDIDTLQTQLESLQGQLDGVYFSVRAQLEQLQSRALGMRQSEYLYYMEHFAVSGDLTMAALVMTLEDDALRGSNPQNSEGSRALNPIQQERYDRLRQLLEGEGLLCHSGSTQINGTTPLWPVGSDPSEDPDTAALGILWCALDQYYVVGNSSAATQFLVEYLGNPDPGLYQDRLLHTAKDDTLALYERLLSDLKDAGCLTEDQDGALDYAGFHTMELYPLPFVPPLGGET